MITDVFIDQIIGRVINKMAPQQQRGIESAVSRALSNQSRSQQIPLGANNDFFFELLKRMRHGFAHELYLRHTVGTGGGYSNSGLTYLTTGAVLGSSQTADMDLGTTLGSSDSVGVDWTMPLIIYFPLYLGLGWAEATAIFRMQFKGANTLGALGARGLGIRWNANDAYGESYETALKDDLALTTMVAQWTVKRFCIINDPRIPLISYYEVLDGGLMTLLNSWATSVNIPQTGTLSPINVLFSVEQAAAVECSMGIGSVWVFNGDY